MRTAMVSRNGRANIAALAKLQRVLKSAKVASQASGRFNQGKAEQLINRANATTENTTSPSASQFVKR
jgi:hypothetical protein